MVRFQETHALWAGFALVLILVGLAMSCSAPVPPSPTFTPTAATADMEAAVDSSQPLLLWEGDLILGDTHAEQCHRLIVNADHTAQWGLCSAEPQPVPFDVPQWDAMVAHFAPFEYRTEKVRLVFSGRGEVSGEAWERALATWAQDTYTRFLTGRACASCGTVLAWSFGEPPEQLGTCSNLLVTNYGYAYLGNAPCQGGPSEIVGEGWLETAEWAQLDAWVQTRQSTSLDASGASYLSGRGSQPLSQSERAVLSQLVQTVRERLLRPE